MRNIVKIGLIAAAVFFLMSGTAAGLETLAGSYEIPLDYNETLWENWEINQELVTIAIRFESGPYTPSGINSSQSVELAQAIYETKKYRVFDSSTGENLPYYIIREPILNPAIAGFEMYTLYIGVNRSTYSGMIGIEYDDLQSYSIKNHSAVTYAITNETWLTYPAQGNYGYLTKIDTGYYTNVVISTMDILTNGNGTSGASGVYFRRPRTDSWSNGAVGFWSESTSSNPDAEGTLFALNGTQTYTSWTRTSIPTSTLLEENYNYAFQVKGGMVSRTSGNRSARFTFTQTPYNRYTAAPVSYNILNNDIEFPMYACYDSVYFGYGTYRISDMLLYFDAGEVVSTDSNVFMQQIAPEQVVISGPTQAFVSDIITLSAAVYPADRFAQNVTWHYPNGVQLVSKNETTITLKCGYIGTWQITAVAAGTDVFTSYNVTVTRPAVTISTTNGLGEVVTAANGSTIYRKLSGQPSLDVLHGGLRLVVTLQGVPASWYMANASDNATITVRFNRTDWANVLSNQTPENSPYTNEFGYTPIGVGNLMLNFTIVRNGVVLYGGTAGTLFISVSDGAASILAPAGNDTHLEQQMAGNNSFDFNWTVTPYYMPTILERSMDESFETIIESNEYVNSTPRAGFTDSYTWPTITYNVDSWEPGTHYLRIRYANGTVADVRTVLVDAMHPRGPISFEILDTQTGRPVKNSSVTLENETSKTYWFDTEETPGIISIPDESLFDYYQAAVYADGYAPEYLTVAAGNNYTVYLVPEASSAHIRFSLIDNTGDFPWGSSHLLIKPQFGAMFDPLYFNAAGEAIKQLTIGQNYSLTIVNASGATRDAGFIIPLGNQTIQLVIGDLLLQKTNSSWGNFSYNLQLVRKSANGAEGLADYSAVLNWTRGEGYTGDAYMTITNTNTSTVIDSVNMTSQTGDRTFQIPYTSDIYEIVLRWFDNGTWYEDIRYITPQKALDALSISPTTRNIVCLCLLFIIALVFSQINAQIGAIVILATSAVMYAIGALVVTPYVLFCVALIPVVALLGNRYLRGG